MVSLELLEKNPKSEAVRAAVEEEVSNLDGLAEDDTLQEKINAMEVVLKDLSEESPQVIAINIKRIKGKKDVLISKVVSTGSGIVGESIDADEYIVISGIKSGVKGSIVE